MLQFTPPQQLKLVLIVMQILIATFKSILGPDPDTPLSTSKVQVNETKAITIF